MTDRPTRIAAFLALALATAGTVGPAAADSISEPDAYTVSTHVEALQAHVNEVDDSNASLAQQVDELVASANDQAGAIDQLSAANADGCLAFSDRHYVRETINGSHRKYRMPLVVWRTDLKACRPDSGPWKNKRIAR